MVERVQGCAGCSRCCDFYGAGMGRAIRTRYEQATDPQRHYVLA